MLRDYEDFTKRVTPAERRANKVTAMPKPDTIRIVLTAREFHAHWMVYVTNYFLRLDRKGNLSAW